MVIFVDLAYSEHAETEMLAVSTYANELGLEPGLNSPEMVTPLCNSTFKRSVCPSGGLRISMMLNGRCVDLNAAGLCARVHHITNAVATCPQQPTSLAPHGQ